MNTAVMAREVQPDTLPAIPASGALTPMHMLQIAVQQGADLDKLQKLMELQERWEANEARKAFNLAFTAFKSEAVRVLKTKSVTDGPLRGKSYAELYTVVNAVTPALSQHGLSASWKLSKDEKDWIEVTCTIRHTLGHFEAVSMGGPPDAGGAKSAIQARASTISYLERYTLKAICGVAEQGDDKDGGRPPQGGMDEGQIADFIAAFDAAEDLQTLQDAFSKAYKAAQAEKDQAAMRTLTRAKDARKAAMQGKA
ncbi:MAG: ERF family protein [Sterolibacterium sp.]